MKKILKPFLMAALALAGQTNSLLAQVQGPQSSQSLRAEKQFTANAAISGVSFNSLSRSLEAGYHLKDNDVLTIQYTSLLGLGTLLDSAIEDQNSLFSNQQSQKTLKNAMKDSMKGYTISIGYKKFLSNSFYIKPELYKRDQEIVESAKAIGTTLYNVKEGSIEDIGASLKIGNQWQWENFTLGIDWIGLSKSLITVKETGNLSKDFTSVSASAINLYLGATF